MSHLLNFLRCSLGRSRWVLLLCLVTGLPTQGQDQTYVVRPKDTLYGIARHHGLTAAQLADRNGLAPKGQVYVGQQLRIPGKAPARAKPDPKPAAAPLNPAVQKLVENARVTPKRWKYIVIHHSGMPEGTLKSIDRYHRTERHMEHGLAYHFLIGNGSGMGDGEIAVGNRWKEQLDGGHLRSEAQNKTALGICLIGNFQKSPPTAKQLQSLENLIRALMKRCALSAGTVRTHQQINVVRTDCPGSKFPTRAFLGRLNRPAG